MSSSLARARDAFRCQAWRQAFAGFLDASASASTSLGGEDSEALAISAYLVGEDDASVLSWETAHRAYLGDGHAAEAARVAFWLGFCLLLRGETSRAGGWFGRAERLVDNGRMECAASGFLLIPRALDALGSGELAAARELSVRATEIGARVGDVDLCAFGMLSLGEALIAAGDVAAGVAQFDEVMVSLSLGEVGPIATGIVYCGVVLECMRLFDLERAAQWTRALAGWCDAQSDLVPYRGQCLVHRSQLQQAAGAWPAAVETAEAACRWLTDPPHPALGLAYYQLGELRRLVGSLEDAHAAYRQASHHGFEPVPGVALLHLSRGDATSAALEMRRALEQPDAPVGRPALLAAAVDVFRAAGDTAAAAVAADELAARARSSGSRVLGAMSDRARGACLLEDRDARAALGALRDAASAWQALRMPYEAARTAVLLGCAWNALGDGEAARLEFDDARACFDELGAEADAAELDRSLQSIALDPANDAPSALSRREREVLTAVAAGKTNRQIADDLLISPHTVSRHIENIFAKLGVSSRAAATAHAYEHGLL